MNDLSAFPPQPAQGRRVAILIDGENISAQHAGRVIMRSLAHGTPTIRRVYGNVAILGAWDRTPGFRLVHSGSGKNATDILLTVEAMALRDQFDVLALVSSDRDFSHLATHLRESGKKVVGIGLSVASEMYRRSCSEFVELDRGEGVAGAGQKVPEAVAVGRVLQVALASEAVVQGKASVEGEPAAMQTAPLSAPVPAQARPAAKPDMDQFLQKLIREKGTNGWFPILGLNAELNRGTEFRIGQTPEKTWRAYLTHRSAIYHCEAKGPNARVRLVRP